MSILAKLKNTLSDTRCVFNQARQMKHTINYVIFTGEYKGFKVATNNEQIFLRAKIPKRYPSAFTCHSPGNGPIILVNEAFHTLPEEHQRAILDHEVCHCLHHDLEMATPGYHNQEWELEADAYSVKEGNNMRATIEHLRDIYTSAYGIVSSKTIKGLDERIDALA